MIEHRHKVAIRNMKVLSPFPLCALSTFEGTSAANRCIDYCLMNKVAARNTVNLKCIA